ncbi:uncharacterized protein LOC135500138 [Lineus longissimus]|uniref:uncharacterized protein LOC135500138 n=1 Tax=Lineus longissimus TaxID=88925 RepID=UPI00315CC8B5
MAANVNFDALVAYEMMDSDEEDDENDDICIIAIVLAREKRARMRNFAEEVVPSMSWKEFSSHFRISPRTFDFIQSVVEMDLLPKAPGGPLDAILPTKQIMVFLWYLANQEVMRSVAVKFGVSESTVHKIVRNVAEALIRRKKQFIRWPTPERRREISASFQESSGLVGVVGAVDGSHIRIMNLPGGESDYYNRKKFPSLQLQLVADDRLLIINTNVGWPGCAHDGRVFRNSQLAADADAGKLFSQDEFLIGDSAYPLRTYLMAVMKENRLLSREERVLNKKLSSCRQVVERAIGLMKGRFRRLRELYSRKVKDMCKLITCAAILHNMCILTDDEVEVYVEEEEVNNFDNVYHCPAPAIALRRRLLQYC